MCMICTVSEGGGAFDKFSFLCDGRPVAVKYGLPAYDPSIRKIIVILDPNS